MIRHGEWFTTNGGVSWSRPGGRITVTCPPPKPQISFRRPEIAMPTSCVDEAAFRRGCDMAWARTPWRDDPVLTASQSNDMRGGFWRMREAIERVAA